MDDYYADEDLTFLLSDHVLSYITFLWGCEYDMRLALAFDLTDEATHWGNLYNDTADVITNEFGFDPTPVVA